MPEAIFGGDEVGAIVFDIGSNTSRCGYAGEDIPKGDIPSYVGWSLLEDDQINDIQMDENDDIYTPNYLLKRKHLCGYNSLSRLCNDYELRKLYLNESLYDFEVLEEMLNYMYEEKLYADSSEHPVLFSEAYDNSKTNRENLTELMFEKYNCTALSFCKSPALSAFANGRTTALVVDLGHETSSICPITDGYCLTQACTKISINGSLLLKYTEEMLIKKYNIDLTPMILIKNKQFRNIGESPIYTLKNKSDDTLNQFWINYHKTKLLQDFQINTFMVNDCNLLKSSIKPPLIEPEYEFPTGYRFDLTKKFHENYDSFMIPELFFNDELQSLLNNIILVGGCSTIPGMNERLYSELVALTYPTLKVKVISPNTTAEKRYGAWIGGSILSSLGSFQQLWISPAEYAEQGAACIDLKSIT